MKRLGAAFALCSLVVFVSGCGDGGRAKAIEGVLAQDEALSPKSAGNDPVGTVRTYARGLRNIDFSGCPDDFRQAYVKHIQAWESRVRALETAEQYKANFESPAAMVEAFMRGLVFDFGMASEQRAARKAVVERIQAAQSGISQTWDAVEQIARRHGARVPE